MMPLGGPTLAGQVIFVLTPLKPAPAEDASAGTEPAARRLVIQA